jgi:hypothetical protein
MSEQAENLYDFATQWLKNKGCKFIDHGGWEVTESSDSSHCDHLEGYPQIVMGWTGQNSKRIDCVNIGTRLWVNDAYNIESRVKKIITCYSKAEVIAALTALHESLCQVNEMLSRISKKEEKEELYKEMVSHLTP